MHGLKFDQFIGDQMNFYTCRVLLYRSQFTSQLLYNHPVMFFSISQCILTVVEVSPLPEYNSSMGVFSPSTLSVQMEESGNFLFFSNQLVERGKKKRIIYGLPDQSNQKCKTLLEFTFVNPLLSLTTEEREKRDPRMKGSERGSSKFEVLVGMWGSLLTFSALLSCISHLHPVYEQLHLSYAAH